MWVGIVALNPPVGALLMCVLSLFRPESTMNIPAVALMIGGLLPLLPKIPMAVAIRRTGKGYNNASPRDQQATLQGMGKRALAAHNNSFEAFPFFAVGVLLALHQGLEGSTLDNLCLVWVAARVAYVFFYVKGLSRWRSAMWGVGLFSATGIYITALG